MAYWEPYNLAASCVEVFMRCSYLLADIHTQQRISNFLRISPLLYHGNLRFQPNDLSA